nr:hypothetical protein [Tanacetum cinerariifolium]
MDYMVENHYKKGYAGILPLCDKCKFHHHGLCPVKCGSCKKDGHQARDCWASTTMTCYVCGGKGHTKRSFYSVTYVTYTYVYGFTFFVKLISYWCEDKELKNMDIKLRFDFLLVDCVSVSALCLFLGKQAAKASKAKSLSALSEVAMIEAQQLKLVTKRSLQQTHISQASGSGADERTGSILGVPDVKENQEKDKIGSKPDKNRKRGKAGKSLKQLQ